MPHSRSWVASEVAVLTGQDRAIAQLALVLAKVPYQFEETLVDMKGAVSLASSAPTSLVGQVTDVTVLGR
jgi:hypothetical protein